MKVKAGLMALTLLAINGVAFAQYDIGGVHYTCPIGANWNDPRCIREPVGGSENSAPSSPQRQWHSTWGAIALDLTTGDVGTVIGRSSKYEAELEAVGRCRDLGSAKCEVFFSYANQCAVIAWPKAKVGRVIAQGAETIDMASQIALSKCADQGQECKVVYSECTKPFLGY